MAGDAYHLVLVRDRGQPVCRFADGDYGWEMYCSPASKRQRRLIEKYLRAEFASAEKGQYDAWTDLITEAMVHDEDTIVLDGNEIPIVDILGAGYRNHLRKPKVRVEILAGTQLLRTQYRLWAFDLAHGERARIVFTDLAVRAEELFSFLDAYVSHLPVPGLFDLELSVIRQWNSTRRRSQQVN